MLISYYSVNTFNYSYLKQYNDFVEAATESISAYTKEVNGKTVPMWEKEEVDEIIAAEVRWL